VGPSRTTKAPVGAESIDVAGKALLPGLWDMHSHLGDADGALDIGSGVTTARDVGNDPDKLDDFKKRFDEGTAVGPHVLRAGFIEGRGDKAASSKITAETEAEAKAGVEFYAKRGYEMMKIYNSVKPELVPVITREAHARGMMVTGHIPVHMLAHEAVRDGYDGIEHANMLFLNFFADHDTDTRTPLRFSIVGDKAADFDLKSKAAQDFFGYLRQKKTVIDPTLVVFEGTYVAAQGKVPAGEEWMVKRLPVQAQRGFLTGGLPLEGKEDLYRRSYEKMVSIVKALSDAKVTVVAGTDSIAGLALDRELELFVKGGLTPAEALRDATIVPARAMKLEKKTGTIAPGKAADLVIVDGDPLANVSDVRKVVTTLRGGVVFSAKDALATVGVRPWE
jgi:Amidohydrolase family